MLIPGNGVELEAALREPREQPIRGAAVLCHPHPLHGGDMNNRTLYRASKAVLHAGWAALRFNFRGVGRSTGRYDEGEGEQQDVLSALAWLRGRFPSSPLALVGFSFGSWVGLQAGCRFHGISAFVGLGLPLSRYDFSFLKHNRTPTLLLLGLDDEFCTDSSIERLAGSLPESTRVQLVDGADHFFTSRLQVLEEAVSGFLKQFRARAPNPLPGIQMEDRLP